MRLVPPSTCTITNPVMRNRHVSGHTCCSEHGHMVPLGCCCYRLPRLTVMVPSSWGSHKLLFPLAAQAHHRTFLRFTTSRLPAMKKYEQLLVILEDSYLLLFCQPSHSSTPISQSDPLQPHHWIQEREKKNTTVDTSQRSACNMSNPTTSKGLEEHTSLQCGVFQ